MLKDELKKELFQMCSGVILLSAIMIVVFALLGYCNLPVIWGTLLGSAIALLNYLLLAFSVQVASEKEDAHARLFMRLSYTCRILLIAVILIIAIRSVYFQPLATIIPLLFPRLVITLTHIRKKENVTGKRLLHEEEHLTKKNAT